MMRPKAAFLLLFCLFQAEPSLAQENILMKTSGQGASDDFGKYLSDVAAGSVPAADMLGISGDSVSDVENVRDLVVAVKGLSSGASKATLAISLTPARTATPLGMDMSTYTSQWWWRVLGALNFGYAQGDADIDNAGYERRAVSVQTNIFLIKADDPIIRNVEAIKQCQERAESSIFGEPSPPEAAPASGGQAVENNELGRAAAPASAANAEAVYGRAKKCEDDAQKTARWNASQFSTTYLTGWIKPKDGPGGQQSLGRAFVAGATYGFEGLPQDCDVCGWMKRSLALYVKYRKTLDEPVLDTLKTGAPTFKDSSLGVVRLAGGGSRLRVLAEVSNARDSDITASQRQFKQALGIDFRAYEATWINLRFGRQRNISGSDDEAGSLLSISYSPSALLNN